MGCKQGEGGQSGWEGGSVTQAGVPCLARRCRHMVQRTRPQENAKPIHMRSAPLTGIHNASQQRLHSAAAEVGREGGGRRRLHRGQTLGCIQQAACNRPWCHPACPQLRGAFASSAMHRPHNGKLCSSHASLNHSPPPPPRHLKRQTRHTPPQGPPHLQNKRKERPHTDQHEANGQA